MAIVGIDLGTTNSLVGVYRDGKAELVPNRFGNFLTPSVVSITDEGIVVGDTAKEIQAKHPKLSASAFKRFIGTEKIYQLGSYMMNSVDLSALVLKSLVEDAELHMGEKVEEAVISVPAYFNDRQKKATIEAARIAGIKVERLINEPTAASLAYHMNDRKEENIIVIVDLGGGTFDVSVLDIFDGVIEVRAVSGDNHFGGEDFDEAIMKHIAKEIGKDVNKLSKEELSQLKYSSEQAKKKLSQESHILINIVMDGEEHRVELSESKLEAIAMNLIDKMRIPLKKAVSDSKFKLNDIDDVILVGGSTRMPLVKKHVARLFNCFPLSHINPDEVVAIGAAIAGAMKERNEDFKDTVLTDVCPFTLGTTIRRYQDDVLAYEPIIERNMTVPVSRGRRYYNAHDNQEMVTIRVYQGDSFNIDSNLMLDELSLRIPRRKKSEVAIDVRFTYDINGILEVEVGVEETGEVQKKIVMNANDLSEDDIRRRMDMIGHLKIHPRDSEENRNIIARFERYYEMTLGEIRSDVADELIMFKKAIETQDFDEIDKARERAARFFEYMEDIN